MNKLLKTVLAIVAIFLLISVFASCNNKALELEQTIVDEAGNVITLDKTCLNLFYQENYVCSFVLPKEATATEKNVAVALKSSMRKLTGSDFKIVYDDDEIDEKQNLVLIGNTKFDESKAVYDSLEERQTVVKISGNKLVIAFSNQTGGESAVSELIKALEPCEKTEVKLKLDWTFNYVTKGTIEDIPQIENSNVKTTDCGNGTTLMTSRENAIETFDAYCGKIKAAGFEEISVREVNGHKFVTYFGENDYVYAYYAKDNASIKRIGTIKVVIGPKETFSTGDFGGGEEKYEPSLAIIGLNRDYNNGQGYVFLLPDGRFIIHDGGVHAEANKISQTLKSMAPDPNNIVIAAWVVSHPHGDHQWAFERFLENGYGDKTVKIESVIFNYAHPSAYMVQDDDNSSTVNAMYKKIEQYLPTTKVIKAHTGQEFKFGSVNMEILYTVEDTLPSNLGYINDSSMVIRLTIGGQKILLLGDSAHKAGTILENMWGTTLKSDVVQLAHHGIWPSNESLYVKVQADVLLWPTQDYCARDMLDQSYGSVIRKALEYAEDVYISNDDVTIIPLPIKVQNNKTDVMAKIYAAEK